MFFSKEKKKSFKRSNINKPKIWDKSFLSFFSFKAIIRLFLVFALIFLLFLFTARVVESIKVGLKNVTWLILDATTKVLWEDPKQDELWNINFLLMGVGWAQHDGGWLTDTMMIASLNPKHGTLTFLSLPRDLYVKYDRWWWGRINTIFAYKYLKTKSIPIAAEALQKKVEEITGIPLNYYVMVDFKWFESFVDELWGLDVDVPDDIKDYRYPGPNYSYTTFKIKKWFQHIDGATALKYTRSRHSTSDFSRSFRQQQIIKAILWKIMSGDIATSPTKIKKLYMKFQDTVKTDVQFKEILGMIKYMKPIPKISSFVINADCWSTSHANWSNITPWCFVIPARREDFGGAAVLIPSWANSAHVDNYKQIQKFAFIIINYPELHLENSKVQILNGIDKKVIRKNNRWYLKPIASDLAFDLKNNSINIVDVWNASRIFDKTTVYNYSNNPITEDILDMFINHFEVYTWDVRYSWSGFDMTIVLGNNFWGK